MVLRPSHPPLWEAAFGCLHCCGIHNGGWEGRKTMHRTPTNNTHTRSGHVFQIFGRRCPDWVWVLQMALSHKMIQGIGVLLKVLIKQHFAPHQETNLEVEFGYMTTLNPISRGGGRCRFVFVPGRLQQRVRWLISPQDGTNKQV